MYISLTTTSATGKDEKQRANSRWRQNTARMMKKNFYLHVFN